MSSVSIEEARAKLSELIHELHPGDEVVITEGERPVARLLPATAPATKARQLGTLRGTVKYVTPDFDAPLEDFKEDHFPRSRVRPPFAQRESPRAGMEGSCG